jgi:hypothetical protein
MFRLGFPSARSTTSPNLDNNCLSFPSHPVSSSDRPDYNTVKVTIPRAEFVTVIVAALVQHGLSLALGNVIDGAISNILGAFSVGVLF